MKNFLFALLGLTCLHGCAPDISETNFFNEHPEAVENRLDVIEIGETSKDGLTFRLLAPAALHVGYSTVWVEILDGNSQAISGRVEVTPVWTSEVGAVLSPFSTVPASKVEDENRFEANPFFLQPVKEDGAWELHVDYEASGNSGTVVFVVDVEEDIWVQHVDGDDDYYVSWVLPVRPTTGDDVIQFALHRRNGSSYSAVEDAAIDLYPYMDMGAGEGHSTPFEVPQHSGAGLYTGEINFIMSGGWDMTAYIDRGGEKRDTVVFKGFTVN